MTQFLFFILKLQSMWLPHFFLNMSKFLITFILNEYSECMKMHNAYSHTVSSCDLVKTYKRSGSVLEWQGSKSCASKSYTAEERGDSSQGAALCRLGLVMQVSRQSMSSKDHQSHKAEQSLTLRGRPSSHLSAGCCCSEVMLPWNWKPMLLDSW